MHPCFSQCLFFMLHRKGWSQERLAQELGVDKSTVSKWINGSREPNALDIIDAIARALDCTPNDLMGYGVLPKGRSLDEKIRSLPGDKQAGVIEAVLKLLAGE